jgi:DNA-binding MarR family transcriptional regulator
MGLGCPCDASFPQAEYDFARGASGGHGRTELGRRVMMHTEIAFANERAIIADMLINLLTNVRLTYLPDLEPADAHELLLTGAHVLIAQLASQPATATEISRVIGRPRDVVTQRLDELIKRGYVEHRGNRYEMTAKLNVRNLQRHMRSNINLIKAAAKRLGTVHP